MAKIITIEFSDDEFENLRKAYSTVSEPLADASAAEVYVKTKFINVAKAAMRSYDKRNAKKNMNYTSFDPK